MGKVASIVLVVVCGAAVPGGFHVGRPSILPPEAYVDPVDQEIARTGVGRPGRPFPCSREVKRDGMTFAEHLPTDRCVRMEPARIWHGLWYNTFEGSQFCPAPAKTCTFSRSGDQIWFTEGAFRSAFKSADGAVYWNDAVYEVTFVGRRTQYRGTYGHLGMFDHEMIVDRPLSIRLVEAPPQQ